MTTPIFDSRMAKGEAIARVGANVRRLDQHEYRVRSQSGSGEYQVIETELGWNCSCPDFVYREQKCKHIFGVELSLQIRRRIENAKRIVPLDYQSCLSCGSEDIIKHGVRKNRNAVIQRYSCNSCGKWSVHNLGFERMGASPEAITQAMQLYFTGESLRNVQKFLRLQGVNVSHVSIYNWIRKYVGLMDKYLDGLTPRVSNTWRADELYVKVKGDMKYLFALMDDETRFWISQQVADGKFTADIRPLFAEGKRIAGKRPLTMITDGGQHFINPVQKEFYDKTATLAERTKHIRDITIDGIVHNNKMERMNGEVRDREKVMRGIKRTDTPILKGYQLFHNYIRPHEALKGETPAERAGIKVEGENKWLTIIQNASHKEPTLNTEETSR